MFFISTWPFFLKSFEKSKSFPFKLDFFYQSWHLKEVGEKPRVSLVGFSWLQVLDYFFIHCLPHCSLKKIKHNLMFYKLQGNQKYWAYFSTLVDYSHRNLIKDYSNHQRVWKGINLIKHFKLVWHIKWQSVYSDHSVSQSLLMIHVNQGCNLAPKTDGDQIPSSDVNYDWWCHAT